MFQNLKGNGRVWVHLSNRPLSSAEKTNIQNQMDNFCASWDAHGNSLRAGFEIHYNQVLVLAVDEEVEAASGCSIDKATALFREIDQNLELDLFNRMNLAFEQEGNLLIIPLASLNEAYQKGQVSDSSMFVDHTVSSLSSLRDKWPSTLATSWINKRIKKNEEKIA